MIVVLVSVDRDDRLYEQAESILVETLHDAGYPFHGFLLCQHLFVVLVSILVVDMNEVLTFLKSLLDCELDIFELTCLVLSNCKTVRGPTILRFDANSVLKLFELT